MKAAVTVLFFVAVSSFYQVYGQASAVMEVRVNVISGASLTSVEEAKIDLSSSGFISENVKAGSFELISAAGSDVNVVLKENPVLINESGASMRFDFFSISRNISSNGNHQISLEGKITDRQHLIGQYKGSVTAVVDYL